MQTDPTLISSKRHWRRAITRTCPTCGKDFKALISAIEQGYAVCCSRTCERKLRSTKSASPSVVEARLAAKLTPSDFGCLIWGGYRDSDGYGHMTVRGSGHADRLIHRLAYELRYGFIPHNKCVCHNCDVNYLPGDITYRACGNVDHLFLATNIENLADRDAKGRQASGDRSGLRVHPERAPAGTRNAAAKLTEEDIPVIRQLRSAGVLRKEVARRFNVSDGTIWFIDKGLSWKHVT